MAELQSSWRADAEAALRALAGVTGAHISDDGAHVSAVFVLADGSRAARKIVRDVEAVLAAGFGIEIDYRKISVAETAGEPQAARHAAAPRLTFENVRLETRGLESEARVELSLGESTILGIARGPATRASAYELVAEACLRAASRFVDESVVFALSGIDRVRIGRDRVIVTSVRMIRGRDERALTGSCPRDRDELRTVAYATLDAINRVFAMLTLREPVEYVLPWDGEDSGDVTGGSPGGAAAFTAGDETG